jgi:hypothetical protein
MKFHTKFQNEGLGVEGGKEEKEKKEGKKEGGEERERKRGKKERNSSHSSNSLADTLT